MAVDFLKRKTNIGILIPWRGCQMRVGVIERVHVVYKFND